MIRLRQLYKKLLAFVLLLCVSLILVGCPEVEKIDQEQPMTEQLMTEQPTTEQPTTEQPTTEQPTTEEPTTEQPTTEQPTTEQPTTEQPTTEQPTTEQPTTEQPKEVAPPDFKVSTSFSSAEPKLIVKVEDLALNGLEKLEYRLERFSDQCNDSGKIFTGVISSPTATTSFDIATENYGAFKLSVTGTYDNTQFQNPMKTILPTAPNIDNPPANVDLSGLVFVDVFDDRSNVVQQIHLPDSDGFIEFAVFNFDVQLDKLKLEDSLNGNTGIHQVVTKINPIGDKNRNWCSSSGVDFVAQNNNILNSGELDGLEIISPEGFQQIFGPTNEVDPIILKLAIEPDTINGNRAPFAFFNLVVHKIARDADGKLLGDGNGNFVLGEEIYNEDHIVQDCATRENPLSEIAFDRGDEQENLCSEFNDFPR